MPCVATAALSAQPVPSLLCPLPLAIRSRHSSKQPCFCWVLERSDRFVHIFFDRSRAFHCCGYVFLMCIFISYIVAGHLLVRYPCHVLVAALNIINQHSRAREDMSKLKCSEASSSAVGAGDSTSRLSGMGIMTVISGGCLHRWRSPSGL